MFASNPFAELSASIALSVMQTYIVVMIALVALGTTYFTLSQYHQETGEWKREKAPV